MLKSQLFMDIDNNCYNQDFCFECKRIKSQINHNSMNALYGCVQDAVINYISKDKEKKIIKILSDSKNMEHCYRNYAEIIFEDMVKQGVHLESIVNIEKAYKEYIVYLLFKIYGDPSDKNNKLRHLMQEKLGFVVRDLNDIYSEIQYQKEVDRVVIQEDVKEMDFPKLKPKKNIINQKNSYTRNATIAKKAIVLSNYRCEIDKNHETFISKYNDSPYVEAHHLIPMEYQDDFKYSLDVEANIISLCPTCHKKLHYGCFEDVRGGIKKLYSMRKKRLEKSGIILSCNDLEKLYENKQN